MTHRARGQCSVILVPHGLCAPGAGVWAGAPDRGTPRVTCPGRAYPDTRSGSELDGAFNDQAARALLAPVRPGTYRYRAINPS